MMRSKFLFAALLLAGTVACSSSSDGAAPGGGSVGDDTSGAMDDTGSQPGDTITGSDDATAGGDATDGAGTMDGTDGDASGSGGTDTTPADDGPGGQDDPGSTPEDDAASGDDGPAAGDDGSAGAGGVDQGGGDEPPPSGPLALTSSAFSEGATIATPHICPDNGGEDLSPPLSWSGGPAEAQSYAIFFQDITDGFSNGFVHWLIWDIPAGSTSLPEGIAPGYEASDPAGAHQGPAWNDTMGYTGPCAPFGTNTYEFKVYALDVAELPDVSMDSTSDEIIQALDAHGLESATLTGTAP